MTKLTKVICLVTGFAVLSGVLYWWLIREEVAPIESTEPVLEVKEVDQPVVAKEVIGSSVAGRAIEAYRFGTGDKEILFVGGIHGGYEWNSVVLAYSVIDQLVANPEVIPSGLTVTIIPDANPDGVYAVVGKEGRFTAAEALAANTKAVGRFNANEVDLNRNFDCKWQPESKWRGETVSAGSAPFSEPEAIAIRDYVNRSQPEAVVFWHSQASAVYASECENGVLPETLDLMKVYAQAADYKAVDSFDAYPITGDSEGWLASIGIPAITVELSSHESIEWQKNWSGVTALFDYYHQTNLAR